MYTSFVNNTYTRENFNPVPAVSIKKLMSTINLVLTGEPSLCFGTVKAKLGNFSEFQHNYIHTQKDNNTSFSRR